jgi:hypothetical protein
LLPGNAARASLNWIPEVKYILNLFQTLKKSTERPGLCPTVDLRILSMELGNTAV